MGAARRCPARYVSLVTGTGAPTHTIASLPSPGLTTSRSGTACTVTLMPPADVVPDTGAH